MLNFDFSNNTKVQFIRNYREKQKAKILKGTQNEEAVYIVDRVRANHGKKKDNSKHRCAWNVAEPVQFNIC